MALPNQLCFALVIFLSIFSLSSLPTSAIFPKVNVSLPGHLSKLVENLCNGNIVENRKFCLKALSAPKAIATRDSTQLGTLIMKLGAANVKATLNVYDEITKKPELVEDPQSANYDVAVIGPEIANCEKELIDAKVKNPRLLARNQFMKYYIEMGYEITSTLELENPNEWHRRVAIAVVAETVN
ncbi:uncharacterized protein LOC105766865 [Gossypium raimondii]|uniref:uncharacterized protein LOC105766865 n=1 Tax=Gossypium raimondii TaxID=29730 RepID=UPI00063AA4ED|nr:uncharacterized protein LOC105766865 [Gossypium raimondii]